MNKYGPNYHLQRYPDLKAHRSKEPSYAIYKAVYFNYA